MTDAQQGSDATKFAFAGAFTLLKLTSTALAYLQAGTTVTTAGDVLVDAANDLLAITVTAVQEKGGRVGIGAGVAVTTFSTTTRAFVGNLTSNPAGQAPLTPAANGVTARNLTVTATATSLLISLGAAGAEPGKPADSTSTKQNPSDSTAANTNTGSAMNQPTTGPQYGFGLSASVAVNFVSDSTDAFVAIPGRVVLTGDLTIAALTTTTALALATALLTSNIGGPTLAGAFIWNEFSGQAFADPTTSDARRTTRAWLTAPLVQAVDVAVTSTTTERILSVSVGFGKIPPKKEGANGNPPTTINIAGAAAVNRLKTSTSAVIGARTVLQASGDVRLQATRTLLLVAITGGVALRGTAAVGASVAVTIADDLVTAAIRNGATVTAAGNIAIGASAEQRVISIAAALAALSDDLALPISVNLQLLTATVRASIGTGVAITAGKNLAVDAGVSGPQVAVAGSGAFQPGNVGIGIAVCVVTLTRTVEATIGTGTTIAQGAN